ncbi:hypothetical protein DFP72DRAFT_1172351 [Ephemerocybe angulata]|uniref:Uncharacterized protein n=1 Tax=Ephemerocybe angulata TaxID=980116 RepID=A0A8H6HQD9_9AGAR|nr:hypothetical protein DFP72DRAFT_1172351 [Tulosesus angulatus]
MPPLPAQPHEWDMHPLLLLHALPWLQPAVLTMPCISLAKTSVPDALKRDVEKLVDKLATFEADVLGENHHLHGILFTQPDALVKDRLSTLGSLSAERMSNLVANLLEYRLLDVLYYLDRGFEPAGQMERLSIPIPPKMFFKNMANWPNLVSTGLRLLRECGDDQPEPLCHDQNSDTTATIFTSLMRRRDTIDGHKVMANFECSAAYLSLIFKGAVELPSTVADFQDLVMSTCGDAHLPIERWETFFSSMKSVHSFKLPLQLCLSISPICLFLPTSLMTKDLNRLLLLQTWQGLGGHRPVQLQMVESILWRALVDSARGVHPLSPRFRSAFREIESLELAQVTFPAVEWFAGDSLFQDRRQKQPSKSDPRERPHPDPILPPDEASDPSETARSSSSRPITRSVMAKLNGTNPTDSPTIRYPSVVSSQTRRRLGAGKQRDHLNPATVRAVSSPPTLPSHATELALSIPRKRTVSTTSDGAHPTKKRVKFDLILPKRIFDPIDLTAEADTPNISPTLNTENNLDIGRHSIGVHTIWHEHGCTEFCPSFHFQEEADWFALLFRTICREQVEGPTFMSNPTVSFFATCATSEAKHIAVGDLQRVFQKKVVVTWGNDVEQFAEQSLEALAMLNKVISMKDFSRHPQEDRVVTGTLFQLLRSARTATKTLESCDFPIPNNSFPIASLASDAYAWDMTVDQPWCWRRWEMPRSTLRWAEVSTQHAYRSLAMSDNGFGTHIDVKSGSRLLVVCQPAPFNPHSTSSFSLLEQFRRRSPTDLKMWSFQAFHLKAGHTAYIRPLVPFLLISVEDSITHMSHFYTSSTIESSCIGFIVSSLTLGESAKQSQVAALSLLRRLVHYYHLVYSNELYLSDPARFPHAPDIMTFDGLTDIFSISSLFEVINALLDTVTDLERYLLIEARRLCRRILAWAAAHLALTAPNGDSVDVIKVWMASLAQQVKAIEGYQEILDWGSTEPRLPLLVVRLESCLQGNDLFRLEYSSLANWRAESFGWPSGVVYTIALRNPPLAADLDGIRGQCGDDSAFLEKCEGDD